MTDLLSGHHPATNLVGLHPTGAGMMRLYFRETGGIRVEDEQFYPFFHLSDRSLLRTYQRKHWIKELGGTGYYRYLCAFEDWSALWEAVRIIMDSLFLKGYGRPQSYQEVEHLHLLNDPITQFLMQTGRTLFKGMKMDDLHRLQLDIETYTSGPHRFSNAKKPGDRIILVSLSDNHGWEEVIDGQKKTEAEMLKELVSVIHDRDPDVIEGHNILGFDLPYILARCAQHEIPFAIGRDQSVPAVSESRRAFGDQSTELTLSGIAGRHVIDTLHLVQNYDATKRSMESYGLKYAARYFGLSSAERTYVEGERISWYWDHEPATLVRYALDDARETRALASHLSGSSFYLAQLLPMSYGYVSRSGAATKIETLLQRAYLRARHSLPRPSEGAQTSGGYTDIFLTGVVGPIVHADVESLYPSLMTSQHIAPASDTLGVFLQLLEELTRLRLETKRSMQAETETVERSRLDAMQSSFKILINSFYGYLGYSRALFNDFAQADRVTKTGQEVLRSMIAWLRNEGGTVVEVDTDGVLVVPPSSAADEQGERALTAALSQRLPDGITVAFSGRYRKMLSYRKKNYALLGYDGHVIIKGSSLISRSMEGFGRSFIKEAIKRILDEDIAGLHALYISWHKTILTRKMDVREFARVETLKEAPERYENEVLSGERNRSAAYEVALSGGRGVKAGERIAYYITGSDPNVKGFEHCRSADEWDPNFPDENTAFYIRRLDEFAEKFRDFFKPADFQEVFSPEGLFPFQARGIEILVKSITTSSSEDPMSLGSEFSAEMP
jgi:DNA polymerase I